MKDAETRRRGDTGTAYPRHWAILVTLGILFWSVALPASRAGVISMGIFALVLNMVVVAVDRQHSRKL